MRGKTLDQTGFLVNGRLYRRIFESAIFGMSVVSPDGRFQKANPTLCRMLGYTERELKRKTFLDITHPDDRRMTRAFHRAALSGKRAKLLMEKRYVRKDRRIIWTRLGISVLRDERGKVINFVTQTEDVTAEKAAQADLQKFKLAVAGASDHILITDADGAILYANKAAERITGYAMKEMLGRNSGKLWGGHMEKSFYKKMWDRIKNKKLTFKEEIENQRKDGERYWAEISISPILNEYGEVLYFVGVERDITRAREIERMKTEFVSIASHQLRTPLTGIKWTADYMLRGKTEPLTAAQKDAVMQIQESNERMIKLVNDLLTVSHIETAGKFGFQKKRGDLINVLRQSMANLTQAANEKKIRLRMQAGTPDKLWLRLDDQKILQAFQNLIQNAIAYSKPGQAVTTGCRAREGQAVCFVRDFGMGIPKYQQKRIFEKFFRADNAVRNGTGGTGLGLYIARSVMTGHDGRIWFKSTENKGTIFYVSLPLNGDKRRERGYL